MKTSYGVLVLNEQNELLLGHVTGQPQWDIPKGAAEPNESAKQAALRELTEEFGLTPDPGTLEDLGMFKYISGKWLHLFVHRVFKKDISPENLACTSFFEHPKTKKTLPEIDGFRWQPANALNGVTTENLARTLQSTGLSCFKPGC